MKTLLIVLRNSMPHALPTPQVLWGTKKEMDKSDSPLQSPTHFHSHD